MAHHLFAGVAELADALDLGSSVLRRGGSSPFTRTNFFYKRTFHQVTMCGCGGMADALA